MIVESAQMLSNCHPDGTNGIYKHTHINHPCSKWVRESAENYKWLCELGVNLCIEYTHRYGKIHKTEKLLIWLSNNIPANLERIGLTKFALAMPEIYKKNDSVISYQKYYIAEKSKILNYTNTEKPYFL